MDGKKVTFKVKSSRAILAKTKPEPEITYEFTGKKFYKRKKA